MDLIDTHQHLILRDRFGYAWTEGLGPLEGRSFTPGDYAGLTSGLGVVGAIFMEAATDDAGWQDEARHVATLVGRGGLLGQVASCRPEEDDGFEAWLDECEGLGVLGFRRILHVMPDDLSRSGTFRANVRRIGARGLTFDLCVLARQLPVALELARACEGTRLVLDHCGVPPIAEGAKGEAFRAWAGGIDALAALPHVACKLSGLPAYAAPGGATAEDLRPWVDHVLGRFGPARLVWGGDWPVVDLGGGLPAWIGTTRDLLAELSQDERAAIGVSNARDLYRC